MLALAFFLTSLTCSEVTSLGPNTRYDCLAGEQSIHVLKLQGNYAQTAYAHARLLPYESIQGPLKEIHDSLKKDVAKGSLLARELKKAIVDCYGTRIQGSISKEFLGAIQSFHQGLDDALGSRNPYSYEDILGTATAIELSIAAEGLMRRLESDQVGTIAELATVCGIQLPLNRLDDVLHELSNLGKMKMGCLGFVSPSEDTQIGALVHGRNFDANLVESWNKAPTIFLVNEPGFYRYVATATAGMFYPGGISGFNEQGISVSLHEMSTTQYRTRHSGRRGEIAPFLQQRILREAASIDQAIQLVNSVKHFGSWTILISDSKTNESASIEISGERVQVARRTARKPLGQANHFHGDRMQNQFFTYSFGKKLESASRLQVIERALDSGRGRVDVDWAIDQLSSHQDAFEGLRAFGRTAVKAYNVMSTIAIPALGEIWMTVGDRAPAAHGTFAGFQVDFESMTFVPLEEKRTRQYDDKPNWVDSLALYSSSRLAYEAGDKTEALRLVKLALEKAQLDEISETTYEYIIARLLLELRRAPEALSKLNALWNRGNEIHTHKRALIALYMARAQLELPRGTQQALRSKRNEQLDFAKDVFQRLERTTQHFDLRHKLKLVSKLRSGQKAEMPSIDFVTVE